MSDAPELSAREFFNQDDSALAPAFFGEVKEEKVAEAVPEVKKEEVVKPEVKEEVQAAHQPDEVDEVDEIEEEAAPLEGVTPVLKEKPITEFKVLDEGGELQIPDLKFKFKAAGQDREMRIDQMVRMAQMGFTNEAREQQVQAAKQFVTQAQTEKQQLLAQLEEYDARVAALLDDPEAYEVTREKWQERNSPEQRALRAEAELQRTQAGVREERAMQTVQTFVATTLVPVTGSLLEKNPLVSEAEVIGRYTQLTTPLLVNGRIPLNRLPNVEQLVRNDLAQWVEARQLERSSTQQADSVKKAKEVKQTAEAKRASARLLSPSGSVGSTAKTKTNFASAREWLDSSFGAQE